MKQIFIIQLLLISNFVFSQNDTTSTRNNAIKTFIDCYFCDKDYIKQEIPFVNYMRDPKDADVHVIITKQATGSGGNEYTFIFFGQKRFQNKQDTLSFSSQPDNTEDEIRDKQVKTLKLGLLPFVMHSSLSNNIEINYINNNKEEKIIEDKWKSWVYELRANSWLSGESNYKNTNVWSNITANKITPDWKIEFDGGANYNESLYYIDEDNTVTSNNQGIWGSNLTVKSLNDHWSVGERIIINTSTFDNNKLTYGFYPSIEFNAFKYSESSTKQLRFLLSTGYSHLEYNELTMYDKMKEDLFNQQLSIAFSTKQKWGSINSSLSGSYYLHDITKNKIDFSTSLSIRLIKGLSFNVSGHFSLIHDQLSLPKEEASLEENLLRQQELSTDYSYWASIGFAYTFGSIYNNVVNPRFGN